MNKFVPNTERFDNYKIINHQPFSQHLTSFLNSKSEVGYVLNLNAEWGAGKTTFLQCWYNELKESHPVIYFDSWKSDFTHDAMTALIDCFHAQLANPISNNKELVKSLFSKGSYFIKKSVPSLAAGYVKHKTGIDNDESLIENITSTFGVDIAEKECGDALKDVLKEVLEQRQKVEGVEEFKRVLVQLAKAYVAVSEKNEVPREYPVYILIDELDRCRPNYAIEVIESIKHFFSTEKFVFVVATDTDQLQHSVKAIYGHDFNAHAYLSRFFHKTVTLPAPSLENFLKLRIGAIVEDDFNIEDEHLITVLERMFQWHHMTSLREIEKVIGDIEQAKNSPETAFKVLPLTLLSILKRLHPEKYTDFFTRNHNPYMSNGSHAPSRDPLIHLPINNAIPAFKINAASDAFQFEHLLHNLLSTINIEVADHFSNFSQHKNTGNRHIKALEVLSGSYRTNPDSPTATEDHYKKLIDLAGHFS